MAQAFFTFKQTAYPLTDDLIALKRLNVGGGSNFEAKISDILNNRLATEGDLGTALANGNNVIFSGVTGQKKTFQGIVQNTTAGALTVHTQLSNDGGVTWTRCGADQAVAANTSVTLSIPVNGWAVGQTFGVFTTGVGLTLWSNIIDQSTANFAVIAIIQSMINGNNILYTVPAGKIGVWANAAIQASNESGGAVSVAFHVVPPAGAPALANRIFINAALANNTIATQAGFLTLPEGYQIIIVSNTAGKIGAYTFLSEMPAS